MLLCVWLKSSPGRAFYRGGGFTGLPAARIAKEISFHRRTPTLAAERLNLLEIRGRDSVSATEFVAWRNDRSRLINVFVVVGVDFRV